MVEGGVKEIDASGVGQVIHCTAVSGICLAAPLHVAKVEV